MLQALLCLDLIMVNLTFSWFVIVSSSITTFYSIMGFDHSPKGERSKLPDSVLPFNL